MYLKKKLRRFRGLRVSGETGESETVHCEEKEPMKSLVFR